MHSGSVNAVSSDQLRTPVRLGQMPLAELNEHYSDAHPIEILRAAVTVMFPSRVALVSSFGSESAILLQFMAKIDASIPILFLDTGKHFDETLMYRDILADRFGFSDLRSLEPDPVALGQHDPYGLLWSTNPDLCCRLRKVDPLSRALEPFDAWITGRKRYQGGTRASLPIFESLDGRTKVNPFAHWRSQDIDAAFEEYRLPRHPLFHDGFRSVGCRPCTTRVTDATDDRSGRWAGLDKTECGIHRG